MDAFVALLVLVLVFVTAALLRPVKTTVFEYERGLRFRRGRFKGVVEPGVYWHSAAATQIQRIDVRPSRVAIGGQEVLSADGVPVKTGIVARFKITDPERAVLGVDNYQLAIHTELQLALRAIAQEMPVDDLLRRRGELSTRLKELAAPPLQIIGIELEDAALRDLTFPGEMKKIFAQVIRARQEGLAALEKARGETAALRNLANAASMVERNPSLMQLRALQALGQQPGNTLVLGMQHGSTPIPLRPVQEGGLPAAPAEPSAEE